MEAWEILKKLQEGDELDIVPDSGGISRKIRLYNNRFIEMKNEGEEWRAMWDFSIRTLLTLKLVDKENELYEFI